MLNKYLPYVCMKITIASLVDLHHHVIFCPYFQSFGCVFQLSHESTTSIIQSFVVHIGIFLPIDYILRLISPIHLLNMSSHLSPVYSSALVVRAEILRYRLEVVSRCTKSPQLSSFCINYN